MPGFEEDRDYFNGGHTKATKLKPVKETTSQGTLSFAKVFGYMFMFLAITAAVAFGLGYVIYTSFVNTYGASYNFRTGGQIGPLYLGLIIGSAVGMIITSIIINVVVIKGKHSVLVPAIIYAVLVGVLFSTLTIFVDWKLMGIAFAITCGVFLIMALIASLSKANFSPLGFIALGLLLGVIPLALINLFFFNETIYWVVSFVIFAAIMFITMYDIWRIRKIADQGQMTRNLSLYCAFIMYTDFINIFIRILYYLMIIFGNKKQITILKEMVRLKTHHFSLHTRVYAYNK